MSLFIAKKWHANLNTTMLIGLIWLTGFLSLVVLCGLQLYVIMLISDFELKNLNPLESSSQLHKTIRPTIYSYFISLVAMLIVFRYGCVSFLLQCVAGGFFFLYINDKKQWFEPRYLFRDLQKIKIRHSSLLFFSAGSAIITLLMYILI